MAGKRLIRQTVSSVNKQLTITKTMKSNYKLAITMTAGAILAAGTSLRAADVSTNQRRHHPLSMAAATANNDSDTVPTEYYRANELSLDGFATGSLGGYTLTTSPTIGFAITPRAARARASIISSPAMSASAPRRIQKTPPACSLTTPPAI
jgi:hypothetical protein